MDARRTIEPARMKHRTTTERVSERELVVTRTFDAPARIVFEAWTRPELFKRWWVPESMGLSMLTCEMDVRVGGTYRFVFGMNGSTVMEVWGRYLEVTLRRGRAFAAYLYRGRSALPRWLVLEPSSDPSR